MTAMQNAQLRIKKEDVVLCPEGVGLRRNVFAGENHEKEARVGGDTGEE